ARRVRSGHAASPPGAGSAVHGRGVAPAGAALLPLRRARLARTGRGRARPGRGGPDRRHAPALAAACTACRKEGALNFPVTDPFGVSRDPAMPFLAAALDPREAEHRLARAGAAGRVRLDAIRVTRYKPGRRCLIEYDLEVEQPGGACSPVTW